MAHSCTSAADYFTPAEILRQATLESAEVIRMCGKLNRHGSFGEIREGWLADLLLIEGDPFRASRSWSARTSRWPSSWGRASS